MSVFRIQARPTETIKVYFLTKNLTTQNWYDEFNKVKKSLQTQHEF